MSRTNKPRGYRSHSYLVGHHGWYKKTNNKRVRQEVRQRLKDVLFTDAYDEKELLGGKRAHLWDRWWCC